jgi:hypothetical protein
VRYLLLLLLFSGCTQDFDAFLGDAGGSNDATSDSPAPKDGGSDVVVVTDSGVTFACGTQTVGSCAQCSGMPEPCVYCGAASALAGKCVAQGMSCFSGAPSGFALCSCQSASTCPESYQVCRNGFCRTCADSLNNAGLSCKGGGSCNVADGGCN